MAQGEHVAPRARATATDEPATDSIRENRIARSDAWFAAERSRHPILETRHKVQEPLGCPD